jgi:hypothetical protein
MKKSRTRRAYPERQSSPLQGSMSRNVRQGSGCQDPFLLAGAVAQLPCGNATSTVSDSPLTLFPGWRAALASGSNLGVHGWLTGLADKGCRQGLAQDRGQGSVPARPPHGQSVTHWTPKPRGQRLAL